VPRPAHFAKLQTSPGTHGSWTPPNDKQMSPAFPSA
jgi:hypothetical protein